MGSHFGFLAGGGEMAARIRAHDWTATPLGPVETWPQSLRTALGMVLASRFPACLVWGPTLVTLPNDAFRPILGAKPEALGRSFSDVWAEAWHEIGPLAERAVAGEATYLEDFPLVVDRSGTPEQAYFTFCYSPVRDETGAVAGFLDTVVETTGKVRVERTLRRTENELRRINETLEARVAARTAELMTAEEDLRQSQKMEAVGQLTSGLAHDFNNLLTSILGNLELIEAGLTDDRMRKRVRAATRSAERGATLTAQLLAFARKQHLNPMPVDLNGVVMEVVEIARRTMGAIVEIRTALAERLWPAHVDLAQIEVALLNVVINARDAMPDGGTILVATRCVSLDESTRSEELESGDYVVLSVSDTGTGMTEAVLARAIEPFFTTKEPGKGTGLGLSQVYGLARQSGGTIGITTAPGAGSAVAIWIPRSTGSPAARDEGPLPTTERRGDDRPVNCGPPVRDLVSVGGVDL